MWRITLQNMPTKTEAVANFLKVKALPELADLYSREMEVQVNVSQGNGERIDRLYRGKKYSSWTDESGQIWKSYRVPRNANTEPEDNDFPITFDLAEHVEGIGLTGWDWVNRKSKWVAYDFDAIIGHSERHEQKLTDEELEEVKEKATDIPWVTVRRSTSGNGLHLYVFLDEIETKNHTEHAALARAILSKMSAETSFDFDSRVDNVGGVFWIWHKKFEESNGGLELVKQGSILKSIPPNWKDHIRVTSGKRRRSIPGFVKEKDIDWFEQLCGKHTKVPLSDQHKALINYLEKSGAMFWFDADHHMLVCHTYDLKKAHRDLNLRGIFETEASGTEQGVDQNCYAFPMREGAWVVRRHTPGVIEHRTWDQDSSGWTRCYFNKEPDLRTASKLHNGAEDENGTFVFEEAEIALQAASDLGANIDLPQTFYQRKMILKRHKDGRLIVEMDRASDDKAHNLPGWVAKPKVWRKVLDTQLPDTSEQDIGNFDDVIRHLVSETGSDAGWNINSNDRWAEEPNTHVRYALKALGNSAKDVDLIMGQAVMNRWTLVNRPFEPEYTGDRQWNRDSAQFTINPSQDLDNLEYPTWIDLINHCGESLNEPVKDNKWCKDNGILTGGEYLMYWIAGMFQYPQEPLPYLFMYGPQNSGKSVFHEALSLLITKGVARADAALISQSGFNGELASAVLCIVEETDLREHRSQAYNRIKDWVTGKTINIHIKGATPYSNPNTTHWVQCANEIEACPVFSGDTRITMMYVDSIPEEKHIPKRELMELLKNEASDFLANVINLEIPRSNDRLLIPVLSSPAKDKAVENNLNELDLFIKEECHFVDGEMILVSEFYDRFREWLDPERKRAWSKIKVTREMPEGIVKGRWMKDAARHYYGNISWILKKPENPKLVSKGDRLEYVQ